MGSSPAQGKYQFFGWGCRKVKCTVSVDLFLLNALNQIHKNTPWRNEEHELINRRNDITQGWQLCTPYDRLGKGRGKKEKFLQHGVFVFGHPPKYYPRRTGLNFGEQLLEVLAAGRY